MARARIVIFSPTELVRDALGLWLSEAGHQVTVCATEDEAASRLGAERVGAFVTAELLPRGRAIPTLSALRERSPGTAIVYVDEGPIRPARESVLPSSFARVIGVDAMVPWPFDRSSVVAAVDRVAGKSAYAKPIPPVAAD